MNQIMTCQETVRHGIPCETTPPDKTYTCEYCGKELPYKGFTLPGRSSLRFFPALCDCKQSKIKRQQDEDESLQAIIADAKKESKEHAIKRLIADSGVKGIYQGKSFEHFSISTEKQRDAKFAVMRYEADFPKFHQKPDETKKGLFFHGSVGTGKTLLASILCNDLTSSGFRCLFTTTDDMMGKIRETFNGEGSEMAMRKAYKDVSVLILDDLGKEKATDWYTSTLFDIIDTRYANGLITIVTANHAPEPLKEILTPKGSRDSTKADAIISRLIGASREIIPMYWEDYRCTS